MVFFSSSVLKKRRVIKLLFSLIFGYKSSLSAPIVELKKESPENGRRPHPVNWKKNCLGIIRGYLEILMFENFNVLKFRFFEGLMFWGPTVFQRVRPNVLPFGERVKLLCLKGGEIYYFCLALNCDF